jgi:TusA-related sulfurtransferase
LDGRSDTFNIDNDLDLRGLSTEDVVKKTLSGLEIVKDGNYMLVYINDYAQIAEIAKSVVTKKATVDNVLKKNENDWVVMIKNEVPVAQAG